MLRAGLMMWLVNTITPVDDPIEEATVPTWSGLPLQPRAASSRYGEGATLRAATSVHELFGGPSLALLPRFVVDSELKIDRYSVSQRHNATLAMDVSIDEPGSRPFCK